MSTYRFFNAKIAQFNPEPSLIDGEVWIENDTILYAGPKKDTADLVFDTEKNCCGDLLLPGFKNAHAHTAMVFLRSHADDLPLEAWLTQQVFPYEELLTPEDSYTLVQLGILEYVSSGITCACEMYYHRDAIVQACLDTGFRMSLSCGGGTGKFAEEEYKKYSKIHPLITYHLGSHAPYTESDENLHDIAELCKQYREPFFIHLHETEKEINDSLQLYGCRPLARLEKMGAFTYGGTGYHLVHCNDEDYSVLQRNRMFAVTCPSSNCKLASGIAPVCKMMEKGIPVAIGTDGAASNNSLDMFKEMFLVSALQKVSYGIDVCPAKDVLKMACSTGADSMHLRDCNDLAAGKQADLILINLHEPNMQPINNILSNLVYAGNKKNIRLTMIAGKVVYENGEYYTGTDPEEIYIKSNAIIRRMEQSL